MKLLVFGTSEFAVPALERLAERHDVAGVITQPDRPAGRGHKLTPTPVKLAAERLGLRVLTPEKLGPFVDDARALAPDAFVVASYGKIVPQSLLDLVPIAFNVHPSLLPLYRGATPIQSAIRDGRTQTAITIIAMDAGMDTGDVLLQERTPIGAQETYGELHDRLARRGAELAVEAVERYANVTLERKPQSEVARELGIGGEEIERSLTRPLRKDDLVVDWERSAPAVVNQIRALAPQPLARSRCYGETVKILAARAYSAREFQAETGGWIAGTVPPSPVASVSAHSRKPLLACAVDDGVVLIERLIQPNRGPISGEDYARRRFEAIGFGPHEVAALRDERDAGRR